MKPLGARIGARAADVDLTDLGLAESDLALLQERLGGATVKSTQLDRLSLDAKLPEHLRRVLDAVQATLKGTLRRATVSQISKDGHVEGASTDALTLRAAKLPSGDAPVVASVRSHLPDGLWGHEHALTAFVALAKDHVSEARVTPALMALCAGPGQGKDQAIEALRGALLKDKAVVHDVDVGPLTDNDADALFGEGGKLSVAELKKIVTSAGVVRVRGADALTQRAPKLARKLCELLLAERGQANHVRLPWIFDFAAGDARASFVNALGPQVNHLLSATASFEPLDGATMARYAKTVLPALMNVPSLSTLKLEVDEATWPLLGQALATPHAPLDQLKARLLRFVLTHFDTETSLERQGGAVLRLGPNLRLDQAAREQLLAALHGPTPSLHSGASLFAVYEAGSLRDQKATREQLLKVVQEMLSRGDDLIASWMVASADSDLQELTMDLVVKLRALSTAVDKLARRMAFAERIGRSELARPRDYTDCVDTCEAALECSSSLSLLAEPDSDEAKTLAEIEAALSDTLQAVKTLRGDAPEPALQESTST